MQLKHPCVRALALLMVAGGVSNVSAQLLQFGPSGGMVITNSSGALRINAAHIAPFSSYAEWAFTLYGTPGNTYTIQMPGGPAGDTLGFDFLRLDGGSVSPTSNPLEFTFTPTSQFMNFNVLVTSAGQYYDGGVFPNVTFSSTLNNASSTRLNVPLVLNPNAVSTPIVLQGVNYAGPVDLFSGGSISGGDGGTLNGPVTTAPGSTLNATGGTLTVGDGSSQAVFNGAVNVAPDATLTVVSNGPVVFGGGAQSGQGTINVINSAAPGAPGQAIVGSDVSQQFSGALGDHLAANPSQQAVFVAGQRQSQTAEISSLNAQIQQANLMYQTTGDANFANIAVLLGLDMGLLISQAQQMNMLDQLSQTIQQLQSPFGNPVQEMQRFVAALHARSNITLAAAPMDIGESGVGHASIEGSFTALSGSQLNMDVSTTGQFDTLSITGSATFNAASVLMFNVLPSDPQLMGFGALDTDPQFSVGFLQTFDVLTASSITLDGLVVLTNDPSGMFFSPSVIDNADGTQTLRLTAVPAPGAAGLLGMCGVAAARRRRR